MGYKDITKYDQTESFGSVLVNDGGKLRQIEKQKIIAALGMGMITEITFKGSDTTANIQAKSAELGDKWYSSDENVYYLYTESGWVNVGSGEDYKKIMEDVGELKSDINNLSEQFANGAGLTDGLKSVLKMYFTNVQTLFTQIAYVESNNVGGILIANAKAIVNVLNNNGGSSGESGGESGDAPSEATLSSISAIYNGGNVVIGTDISALTGITVTALYSDGSVITVTDYTLSGTIEEGENIITVSYAGMTTSFTVIGIIALPEGFAALLYIESTGTQYIDLGRTVYKNSSNEFLMRFELTGLTGTQILFGSYTTSVGAQPQIVLVDGNLRIDENNTKAKFAPTVNEIYEYNVKNGKINLGGNSYDYLVDENMMNAASNTYVFCRNYGETDPNTYASFRLYKLTYIVGGVETLHLIPVLDADGTPCMYDVVSQTCFYNKGTGTFEYSAS